MASQFVMYYSQLFRGEIRPENAGSFFDHALTQTINHSYLESRLQEFTKEQLLSQGPTASLIFCSCLEQARKSPFDEARHFNAVQTLSILISAILANNPSLSGYEIAVILARNAQSSDKRFVELVDLVKITIADSSKPQEFRHQVLQLGLLFMLRMSQLSPGAYFLRDSVFSSIAIFINDPETTRYTFEATLFLTVLCNFQRVSMTPNQNDYLKKTSDWKSSSALSKISWAAIHVLNMSIEAYSPPSHADGAPGIAIPYLAPVNSFMKLSQTLLKMGSEIIPSPSKANVKDPYKHLPIEGTVILWPVYELFMLNQTFRQLLLDEIQDSKSTKRPLIYTVLSLSSYIFSHATAIGSPRSLAYASLCLSTMGELVDSEEILGAMLDPASSDISLCRQREPQLPLAPTNRPAVCALLDCTVLWLRHNLAKQIQAPSYTLCINTCYRVIFFLASQNFRLDYEWKYLWDALLGLLSFLSGRLDDLLTTGGVELLIHETLWLLYLCVRRCDRFLPSASAVHQYIYELACRAEVIRKQRVLLDRLASPNSNPTQTLDPLTKITLIAGYYEEKMAGSLTANQAMSTVAKLIDAEGIYSLDSEAGSLAP